MKTNKPSKNDLINALKKLEKNPKDKVGVASEMGLLGISTWGSAATATTLLTSTVTTTSTVTAPILGSTFLGGLFGAEVAVTSTAVLAAPALPVIAIGLGGAAVSYGLIKLVKDGVTQDHKRRKLKERIEYKIANYDKQDKNSSKYTHKEVRLGKLAGIYAELLKLDVITIEKVQTIFIGIDNHSISPEYALNNANLLLKSIAA